MQNFLSLKMSYTSSLSELNIQLTLVKITLFGGRYKDQIHTNISQLVQFCYYCIYLTWRYKFNVTKEIR